MLLASTKFTRKFLRELFPTVSDKRTKAWEQGWGGGGGGGWVQLARLTVI